MANKKWNEVTSEDVINAIYTFEIEKPDYPSARSTFLIYNGKKYPAKHIRGMAYKIHFGTDVSKNDYSGGKETELFFKKLGFEVQYTHRSAITHPVTKVNTQTKNKSNNHADTLSIEVVKESKSIIDRSHKIKIPSKGVIQQKNALQLILNKLCNGDLVCEKTFSWMKTPSDIVGEYRGLYNALSAYRGNKDFAKKNITLRCDFVCEGKKLIIEYDERQHFSEARRISLLNYPNIPVYYNKQLWIDACRDIQEKDNQPPNRDEVRAYYDSIRDINAAKHGYKLVRIMHGQIDFEKAEAEEIVKSLLGFDEIQESSAHQHTEQSIANSLKIGLYLQTYELHNDMKAFNKAMSIVRKSDIDILVLPECSYVPFSEEYSQCDFLNDYDRQRICDKAIDLSREIGRAIVICNTDKNGTIMSLWANALAAKGETRCKEYIKHTMTDFSACDIVNYRQIYEDLFDPIIYHGNQIGMTICYDCNHSMFSRKYGLNGVDIILNCTGGNVVYDKWFKYNKVRAIENHCFTFVTMGGVGTGVNPHNYVYGFTPEGKVMHPILLNGKDSEKHNHSGGIYVYDTTENDNKPEVDSSIEQTEKVNKNIDIYVSEKDIDSFINHGKKLADGLFLVKKKSANVILCLIDGYDITKPEKVLKLLYADELKDISNKKYLIINRWEK